MKKIFSTIVAGIIFGVILTGAGVIGKNDEASVKIAQERGRIIPYTNVNVPFLTPITLNYYVVQLFFPLFDQHYWEHRWLIFEKSNYN